MTLTMGTLIGPVLGAFLIVALENKVGDAGNWLRSLTGIEWFGTLGESVGQVIVDRSRGGCQWVALIGLVVALGGLSLGWRERSERDGGPPAGTA